MRIDGVVFDLDGTLTDSMHIWNEAPKALVRRFGGAPPEDLAEQLKEMGRLEASEYMTKTFRLPCTPQQIMDGVNELVTRAYREQVPAKPGAAALLDRLKRLGVPPIPPPLRRPARRAPRRPRPLRRVRGWPRCSRP